MERSVRGWFKLALPVQDFIAEYSRLGGTHHLAVTCTTEISPIETFGRIMGWESAVIS